jgi:hypothetical protein
MNAGPNYFLIVAAGLSALAGLLHLGCIIFGASWYRFSVAKSAFISGSKSNAWSRDRPWAGRR